MSKNCSFLFAVAAAVLLDVAASAQNADLIPQQKMEQSTLQIFNFLGQNTEEYYSSSPISKYCKIKDGEVSTCIANFIISDQRVNPLFMSYSNKKLYGVLGKTDRSSFPALLSAFSEKYGQPVLSNREWRSRIGATFKNTVARWNFKGGFLELSDLGDSINTSNFTFLSSENEPPPPKPKVDF